MTVAERVLWLDASAGVAGDMLLAALLDAGADLDAVRSAVDAVIPGTVRLDTLEVVRAGQRAVSLQVELAEPDQPDRRWRDLEQLLLTAPLDAAVRQRALAAFAAIARAEARVHGVEPEAVHFHEVGAWDSIADVVGVCAAIGSLGVDRVVVSVLALGSGTARAAHGVLPVPVPAVLELTRGWAVMAGGERELATPTGVALVTTLASASGPLPDLTVQRVGVGAGSWDRPDRPNVVRAVVGTASGQGAARTAPDPQSAALQPMLLVETTVDDLDPRVWPTVLDDLLAAGAADVWVSPVVMKKGRPGHVLSVLVDPARAATVRRLVLDRTSVLGVRQQVVHREILDRSWQDVEVGGGRLPVKIGHRDGVVVHVTPEFDDALGQASAQGRPVREILEQAAAAAVLAGLVPGAPVPPGARPER